MAASRSSPTARRRERRSPSAAVADRPNPGRAQGAPRISRRDAAKDERRERILKAARELIRDTGETGLSMRPLADLANVSVSTTYNLFGSKHAVLTALLDSDIASYQADLSNQASDALDRIFEAVRLGSRFFAREPDYYRAVLTAVYGAGPEYRNTFRGPRRAFWRGLVDNAIAAGYLVPDVRTETFATNLVFTYLAAIMEWASGEMSLKELEERVQFGFALSLRAVAAPAAVARLDERMRLHQARLARYDRRPGTTRN
jgi:AcrR family transcriptional regulator